MQIIYPIIGALIPLCLLFAAKMEGAGKLKVFCGGGNGSIQQTQQIQKQCEKLLLPLGSALLVMDIMLFSATKLLGQSVRIVLLVVFLLVECLLAASMKYRMTKLREEKLRVLPLVAHAKINLTLNVGKKRDDGFHEVKTVMAGIGLKDQLSIYELLEGGITVKTEGYDVPDDGNNLCCKAARAFFKETDIEEKSMHIELKKGIPVGAGMGGGSADAAAVLRGMKTLYAPEMDDAELERIAGTIGSDIAFLIRGGTAMGVGKGEVLSEMPEMPSVPMVVCKPDVSYSTKEMYGKLDEAKIVLSTDEEEVRKALKEKNLKKICANLANSFEMALPEDSPCLKIRDALLTYGALGAMLSGSGSAVFGLFESEDQAKKAYEELKGEYRETFLTVSSDKS